MENNYAFESKEQFVEYSYGNWNITLSDEIDYIGISIRHKREYEGNDMASPIYNEQASMNVAEQWCDDYDKVNISPSKDDKLEELTLFVKGLQLSVQDEARLEEILRC